MRISWLLAMIGLAVAMSSCGGSGFTVDEAVTARSVDGDYRPLDVTDTFAPEDTFHCAVRVTGLPKGARVAAQWYYEGQLIEETLYVAEKRGSGYIAFQLSNAPNRWPVGAYRVKILVEGEPRQTVDFRVRGD